MQNIALNIMNEVKKAVVGKDDIITKMLIVILAKGHILLEDTPGVGKTTIAVAFSKAMSLDYKRIQFTPEVMPADVVGFSLFNKATGKMEYQPGAVLCNLLLADEINRTSAKTQSALLEAMEERKVTVDGVTRQIPSPNTVIATQNPYGSAGTQLLPESQLDRFTVRLSIGYPSHEDEVRMLKQKQNGDPIETVRAAAAVEDIARMQSQAEQVHVHNDIYDYIVQLTAATREHPMVQTGISPRGSVALTQMAKACAWIQSRDYVLPKDVRFVLHDVLEHRLVLAPKAKANAVTARQVLSELAKTVPEPNIAG